MAMRTPAPRSSFSFRTSAADSSWMAPSVISMSSPALSEAHPLSTF